MGGRGNSYRPTDRSQWSYFTPEQGGSAVVSVYKKDYDFIKVKGASYYSKPKYVALDKKYRLAENKSVAGHYQVAYSKKYIVDAVRKEYERGNEIPGFIYGVRNIKF